MNLKIIRKEKGLTQQALAEMVNVDKSTVSCWERGVCFPQKRTLLKLVEIFQCTIEDLLKVD